MAIPHRQIGQSQEANLIYNLSKQLNNLTFTISAGLANVLAQSMLYTDAGLATKQDLLVSGDNIKTINGNTILGPGDILIETVNITVVSTYSNLPPVVSSNGQFFWVENSEGTQWLPGSLGGTYYPRGMYYSNGIVYEYTESPYQANQAEVDAGINNTKFVSSFTLKNSAQWLSKFNVPLGNSTQYLNGAGVPTTFPTIPTGATNLAYTASPTNGVVTSDTGTDATIPLVDYNNAGLIASSEKQLLYNNSSTGITKFGGFSINADTTKYNTGIIEGWFVDNTTNPNLPTKIFKSFPATTGNTLSNIATQNVTYIAVDINGVHKQSGVPFEPELQRDWIPLGVVIHSNRLLINAINNQPVVGISTNNQLSDLMESIGIFNITGNVFSPNGANLRINKSLGQIFKQGSNFVTNTKDPHTTILPALVAPANLRYRTQLGTESANTNVVFPNFWDNAGVVTAMTGTRWSIQRIYVFQSNLVRIQYGQATYSNLAEAIQSIPTEAFVVEQNILENGLFRGLLLVRNNATDLTNPARALFIEAAKFGSVAGLGSLSTSTLQQAYNNSITPEIITNSTLGAISIKRGSDSDTDFILEGINGSDVVTFSVTGEGTISGTKLVKIGGTSSEFLKADGSIDSNTYLYDTVSVEQGGTGATTNTGVLIGNGIDPTTSIAGTSLQYLRRNSANTGYEFADAPGSGGSTLISGTLVFDFGVETDYSVQTVLSTVITDLNIKSISFINIETSETTLDDFSLNGVSFNIENIVNNVSFDIKGNATNNASGNYTIKYLIQI